MKALNLLTTALAAGASLPTTAKASPAANTTATTDNASPVSSLGTKSSSTPPRNATLTAQPPGSSSSSHPSPSPTPTGTDYTGMITALCGLAMPLGPVAGAWVGYRQGKKLDHNLLDATNGWGAKGGAILGAVLTEAGIAPECGLHFAKLAHAKDGSVEVDTGASDPNDKR